MKVNFNKDGMEIQFDKVPKFLYFNENNEGCGKVYLDGVQRKLLQEIKIQARTMDENGRYPLKYKIQYGEPGNREPQIIGNMKEELSIGIKILDLDVFSAFLEKVKVIIADERIPENIRQEHTDFLLEFTDRFEKEEN